MASIFKFATHAHKWWFCKISRSYRHSSRSSKPSLDYPYTFLNYLDTFRIVQKLSISPRHISRSSRLFLDYLDTFLRLSGHCLDRTETFQIIQTLLRLSGHIFKSKRTLLGSSGNLSRHTSRSSRFFFHFIRTLSISSGYFVLQSIWKFFSQ